MRRVYLAMPIEYEDLVLDKLGQVGTLQFIKEFETKRPEKNRVVEIDSEYERLNEKIDSLLTKHAKEISTPEIEPIPLKITFEDTENFLNEAETELNKLVSQMETLQKEVRETSLLEEKRNFLASANLETNEVGTFRHVFVRVGFLKSSLTSRLATYLSGTSVVSIPLQGRRRENFVVIAGLNEDWDFAEETLKILNFEEVTFPTGLNPDSQLGVRQAEHEVAAKKKSIEEIRLSMAKLKTRAASFAECIRETVRYEEAKELVMRTETKSLIHGWVPYDKVNELRTQLESVVPSKDSIYFRVEKPEPEDTVPVQYGNKGVLRAFELFTRLQGVPNYFEINPTPVYTLLFVVMFGMMFGDIGAGIALVLIGLVITRLRKGIFAFSNKATKQIASITISCGLSTVVFGFFYGVFFLVRTPLPNLLSPLTSIEEIIVIALAFGIAQIILSLILNIINMTRRKEHLKAIFGERGLIGLIFYLSGVEVGYAFVIQKNFEVFFQGTTAIFTSIAILCLALIFFSPLIESRIRHEEKAGSNKLLEGLGLGLEAFIAFIANSVSYIRLAAFAIAHEAIGIAAVVLGTILGGVAALVLMNVLDFMVEGFASFIQSLRLMYYEFSTRFFLKDGIAYAPFKIGQIRIKT